ncbi:MAG TPA: ABC transporter permease [Polyangiaceae bacterium]|nr:ABC transporter permease [Polyangiaceae bacterium]
MASPLRLLLSVSFRNLGRNRRRTLIAGTGIALGVGMCIASFGVMDGMSADMIRSITDAELGHVQVRPHDFSAPPKLTETFDGASALASAAEATPGVEAASPRVRAWTLAASETESVGMELVGVIPDREARVTHLDRRLTAGRYLPDAPVRWPEARPLSAAELALDAELTRKETARAEAEILGLGSAAGPGAAESGERTAEETQELLRKVAPAPDEPPPVLLGRKLAKKLHVVPGGRVEASATDRSGNPVSLAFRVAGVVDTSDPTLDGVRAYGNLRDVERWLGLGERAQELSIRVQDPGRARAVAARLSAAPVFHGLDVKTWRELRPDVVAMLETNGALTAIMVVIIFAIAAIGVADTVLMTVFERRRELGVLTALGMRPLSIVLMVATETLLLGTIAAVGGLLLGVGVDLLLGRHGIPLSGLAGFTLAGAAVPPVLHASLTARGALLPLALMVPTALLAALWPAVVAARTQPALAMKER